MGKLHWDEKPKSRSESRWTWKYIRRMLTYVFCGIVETTRAKKTTLRILEEEFYSDDFNDDTLELMYTTIISTIEKMKQLRNFWKNDLTYNEKNIREFAKTFCFSSKIDIIDKMTEYLERMAKSMIKLYDRPRFILIVNVKLAEDQRSKFSLCVQVKGPKGNRSYKYSTDKTEDGWGEMLFFDLGQSIANHNVIIHFFDETEETGVNWFSTAYRTRKVLLVGQVPLAFDINEIPYLVIGERAFEYETAMRAESETKRFVRRGSQIQSSNRTVNTRVSVNSYRIQVKSNLKAKRLQKLKQAPATKSSTSREFLLIGNQYLKGNQPLEKKIATTVNNFDIKAKVNFYLGIAGKPQKANDIRMLTLYYRLMIIKKAKCELLTRDTRKVYNLQFLFWNDMIDVKEDKLFNYIIKSHCIQHNITAGEDYACRCMAVFASVKYRNILFEPSFIGDCLIELMNHKEQLEYLPLTVPIALNTAYNGLLNYILSNYLRNITFILDKDVIKAEENLINDQLDIKPVKSGRMRSEDLTVHASMIRLRQFSQKQKAIVNSLDAEMSQQLLQSLVCVNTLIKLSENSRELKNLFERHLQQNVFRWFKDFMRSEKPQINEFLEKFLDQLLVGDKYFQKAQIYSKYSYILTSAVVIIVDQAKRIIDSHTKLTVVKGKEPTVVFESDYIKDLFLHLIRLSNYIEKSYTKLEAIELHNLKNEIIEYLPSTIAMLFNKDTQSLIESVKQEENFAPIDASQNIHHCQSGKRLTQRMHEMINMGLEDLRLPPHLFGEELTKYVKTRCVAYCEAVWKRLETEKFFINPLKQGVGPEAFVAINTYQHLASFLVSEKCGEKFSKALGSVNRGKALEVEYDSLSKKVANYAKKTWKIVVDGIMGMLSQVLLFLYSGLEGEGFKPTTLSNTVSMLMFQAKHRIQDEKLCDELLIDAWAQFLQLFERILGNFQASNTALSKDGLNRMFTTLNNTVESATLIGINADVINFQNSLENLKSHFIALIVSSKIN